MTDRVLSAIPADLDRIHVRFATYRERSAPERDRFARLLDTPDAAEHVLLDTCHRVELVTVEEPDTDGASLVGRGAVARVFEVVAGFDSAVVAEEQLLGQVRGAYEAALADGATGPVLNELFRRALRFGRRVRSHARPGTDRSLADRGAAWLIERLPDRGASIVVAGTGEMGRLIATHVARAGHRVTVVSASADRGGRLVEQLDGDGHRLHVGPISGALLDTADSVVLAVRSRRMALTGEHLGGGRPLVLDLSSPGAVDGSAMERLGDRLLTLDALAGVEGSGPALRPDVERRLRAELDAEVERFVGWLDARQHADALTVLHGEAEAVRRRHLDRLGRRTDLDAEQLAAVDAASAAMLNELLHGPSMELRRGGSDAATVRRLFGIGSR